jgi:AraC-like DNA-binding protein
MSQALNIHIERDFHQWHELSCRAFSLSECRRQSSAAFQARISRSRLGVLDIADTSLPETGVTMTRGLAEIKQDQRDHFMLFLVKGGQVNFHQGDRHISASQGDLLIYDQTTPFSMSFEFHKALLVNIPRALLSSRLAGVDQLLGRAVRGSSPLGSLLGGMVGQLGEFADDTPPTVAERVVGATLDVLATALDADLVEKDSRTHDCHRLLPKVERYILDQLHEPELSLATIASALNIAPRTLSRVFAAKGTTPIRWLWKQRLNASYRALAERQFANVTDAALNFGFSDMSHFSRAFKQEFGLLPHAVQQSGKRRSLTHISQ